VMVLQPESELASQPAVQPVVYLVSYLKPDELMAPRHQGNDSRYRRSGLSSA